MFKRTITVVLGAAAVAALSSVPAAAQTIPPSNAGTGALTGTVDFDDGMGVPPAGVACEPTSWTFRGGSPNVGGTELPTAAFMNTVLTGYAGPITITATGGSACENAEGSTVTGTLAVTATGRGPTGSEIDCPGPNGSPLTGTYDRVGTHTTIDVRGQCVVNRYGIATVRFITTGEFVPTDSQGNPTVGPGLLEPVDNAVFTGAFAAATL